MKNALSIDLEDCLCNEFLLRHIPADIDRSIVDDQVIKATDALLKLLDKYHTKATFFVLGEIAAKHPDYIKMLHDGGHEIGSHTYSHTTLHKLGQKRFEEELKVSTHLIKSIIHEQPVGFRAPSFSVDQSTAWAFDLLEKYGYKYDSSIFPVKTMLYGVPKALTMPYRPSLADITKNDPGGKIIEFPLSVVSSVMNIPVSGGFYLRCLPGPLLRFSIGHINKKKPAIIYIHPWEIYTDTIRVKSPPFVQFEAYYGIRSTYHKLEMLLKKYEFEPVRSVLNI
jgi:peptidoglycan-N-acetylglucosamine deacetylase